MPEALRPTWPCRRLVLEGHATIHEVTHELSIDEVDEWCIASDYYFDVMNRKQ